MKKTPLFFAFRFSDPRIPGEIVLFWCEQALSFRRKVWVYSQRFRIFVWGQECFVPDDHRGGGGICRGRALDSPEGSALLTVFVNFRKHRGSALPPSILLLVLRLG